jgi:ribonuclease HII
MGRRPAMSPSFRPFESTARAAGFKYVVGLDEAGRGPLAGPVVAAAVILASDTPPAGLQDSKRHRAPARRGVWRNSATGTGVWGWHRLA